MLEIIKNTGEINQHIFTHLNFEEDCYKIINKSNEIIGYIDFVYEEYSRCLYICMMEILKDFRRKGYGTKVIESLFNKFPNLLVIEGSSLSESDTFNFWKENNAIFKSCQNCSNYDSCDRKTDDTFYCDAPEDLYFKIFR